MVRLSADLVKGCLGSLNVKLSAFLMLDI